MKKEEPVVVHIDQHADRYSCQKIKLSRRMKREPKVLDPTEVMVVYDDGVYYVFALTQGYEVGKIN